MIHRKCRNWKKCCLHLRYVTFAYFLFHFCRVLLLQNHPGYFHNFWLNFIKLVTHLFGIIDRYTSFSFSLPWYNSVLFLISVTFLLFLLDSIQPNSSSSLLTHYFLSICDVTGGGTPYPGIQSMDPAPWPSRSSALRYWHEISATRWVHSREGS